MGNMFSKNVPITEQLQAYILPQAEKATVRVFLSLENSLILLAR